MDNPSFKVFVRCMTFNQSKYIIDTMDGFAMQQTKFPYICAIMDDASTDSEQDVIKEYVSNNFDFSNRSVAYYKETEYAHIIYSRHKSNLNCYFLVFFLKENHYSNPEKFQGKKMEYISRWRNECEYEAICEGDDYWNDPLKLQKQIDFLDANPDYGMSVTACLRYYQSKDEFREHNVGGVITFESLLKGNVIYTPSVVVRTKLLSEFYSSGIREDLRISSMGDYQMWLWMAANGKVHYLNDITTVYRILQKSASHGSYQRWLNFMLDSIAIRKYFSNRFEQKSDVKIDDIAYKLARVCLLKEKNKKKELQLSAKLLDTSNMSNVSKLVRIMILYAPQILASIIKWRYKQENHPSWIYRMSIKCKSH